MSYKPAVKAVNDDKYYRNALAFATPEEAEGWGKDLLSRWLLAEDVRVEESDEPISHTFLNGRLDDYNTTTEIR